MVTGAGTGFGAALALRAAQEGAAKVLVHYRSSAAGAERTAERVHAAGAEADADPGRHHLLGRTSSGWRRRAFGEFGGLDVLINNVGDMASGQASWTEVTEEAIDHVLAVDIKGTMLMVHEFGQRMVERERRRDRQRRLDRDRPRQPARAAIRRRQVRAARDHQVLRQGAGAEGPDQHLRAGLHGDRGAAGAARVEGGPA